MDTLIDFWHVPIEIKIIRIKKVDCEIEKIFSHQIAKKKSIIFYGYA